MNPNKLFQNRELTDKLLASIIKESSGRKYRIMEVCGTHTMAIARCGITSLLPDNISLISGPGCPVCVTSQSDIDNAISLSKENNTVIGTFGDMLRVIGSNGDSLYNAKATGADVRVLYSSLDMLQIAKNNPDKKHVFIAVGFETTAPTAAALIKTAYDNKINNLYVLLMCKTMPAAFDVLLQDREVLIDGFLCPGHVTVVTGLSLYEPLVNAGKAAVIAGFEPADILASILEVIRQVNRQKFYVANTYKYAVHTDGNKRARQAMDEVFEHCDTRWRGLGILPLSGLKIKDKYSAFDAAKVFNLDTMKEEKQTACRCGDVLKGKMSPTECPLFGTICVPEKAVGPCMVSGEGVCAAYYKYRRTV